MGGTDRHAANQRYARDEAKHVFFAGIVERAADAVAAAVGESRVAALFLIGAPSRGEATVVETTRGLYSLSDIDLVCFTAAGADLVASRASAQQAIAKLNRELASVCAGVDVSVRPRASVEHLAPLIFNYEFTRTPVLLRGDASAKNAFGRVRIEDIPPGDALRLVHNRCIEQLLAGTGAADELGALRTHYRTAKLMLDLVTAFLFVRRNVPLGYEERVTLFVDDVRGRAELKALAEDAGPLLDELPHWARFKTAGDARALRSALSGDALAGAHAVPFALAVWKHVLGAVLGEDLSGASVQEAVERLAASEGPARSLARSWKTLRTATRRSLFPAPAVLRGALHASPVTRAYVTGLILLFSGLGESSLSAARTTREWTRAALTRYAPFSLPSDFSSKTDAAMRQALILHLARFHREVLLGRAPASGDTGSGDVTG